ncbi:MAG: complex I NDUFA9 subunit family protein [Betaproteobacteria bacterium]|nr:complex I NDUFA9 subunit family protein [Betaproteobacteria bacterium]MDE2153538.1 complex I NDUFA9 subunit family protein [Betaproteobacteria bacterium]
MQDIVVFGGSGFIGTQVVARLSAAGCRVLVPTRRRERAKHLLPLPTVDLVQIDTFDSATLRRLVQGRDAVVNLVGILHGRRGRPYGPDFARAHVRLPQKLAEACAETGVRRFVHMSALGADSHGPSMYLRSKGDGEAAVRAEEAGLQWTILRPSVVFGEDDDFLNLFARLQRRLPFVLLGGASQRFAPVYVGDLAQAVVSSLIGPQAPATVGRIYELGGPQVRTLRELVHDAGVWAGVNHGRGRPIVGLPHALAAPLAALLELAPGGPLMSRDNLDSMRVPSVPDGKLPGFAPELGVAHPASAEALAPAWLRHLGPQAEYDSLRSHAGR